MMFRMSPWAAALIVLVCAGCAQVASPDGGGRDTQAPIVVLSDPPFGTLHFEGAAFTLTFDEFVQLQDVRRQLLVSPPLPEPARATVRGRSVRVQLGDSLLPDRTYIVQFGAAVRDLREANVADGLQFVFSTGGSLDSGRVAGRAEDAWSGEVADGARVLLYAGGLPEGILDPALPDSVRPLPDYVGLVKDSGRFEVGYLPGNAFGCVVLDDVNGNYRVDAAESVGWLEGTLDVAVDSAALAAMWGAPPIRMDAPPIVPATYLSGIRFDSSGYFRAAVAGLSALREGADGALDQEFELSLSGAHGAVDVGLEGDSIWAQLPEGAPETGGPWVFIHPAGSDTVVCRNVEAVPSPVPVGLALRHTGRDGVFSMRFAPSPSGLDSARCSGKWILLEDTVAVAGRAFGLTDAYLKVGPFPEGAEVELMLEPGAIAGAGGSNTDTLRWRFEVRKPEDFGTIRVVLPADSQEDGDALWLLTLGSGLPNMDARMGPDGRFEGVLPGKYGVVMVQDQDGNGRWTGADPSRLRLPEPVFRAAEAVDVRAGWEIELAPEFHPRP